MKWGLIGVLLLGLGLAFSARVCTVLSSVQSIHFDTVPTVVFTGLHEQHVAVSIQSPLIGDASRSLQRFPRSASPGVFDDVLGTHPRSQSQGDDWAGVDMQSPCILRSDLAAVSTQTASSSLGVQAGFEGAFLPTHDQQAQSVWALKTANFAVRSERMTVRLAAAESVHCAGMVRAAYPVFTRTPFQQRAKSHVGDAESVSGDFTTAVAVEKSALGSKGAG